MDVSTTALQLGRCVYAAATYGSLAKPVKRNMNTKWQVWRSVWVLSRLAERHKKHKAQSNMKHQARKHDV